MKLLTDYNKPRRATTPILTIDVIALILVSIFTILVLQIIWLSECLALSDEFKESYDMLQEMLAIVRTASFSHQLCMLEDLLCDYKNSPYESVRHCVNTVRHNKGYILNAFRYSRTNAACEGVNNKIKILKKKGYGAHKFGNFRKRILSSPFFTVLDPNV